MVISEAEWIAGFHYSSSSLWWAVALAAGAREDRRGDVALSTEGVRSQGDARPAVGYGPWIHGLRGRGGDSE
jgi:hypothetical protein